MRASSAAASTRLNVFGPIVVRPTALPDVPASRISETAESSPPIVHTSVDSSFGLIADRRARSGFGGRGAHGLADVGAGEEPGERERDERHRDQHRQLGAAHADAGDRPRAGDRRSGTACRGWRRRCRAARSAPRARARAMPIVATSTITRGARNSRVITVSSTAAANAPPASDRDDRRGPEAPVVLDHEQREQRGRERTRSHRPRS